MPAVRSAAATFTKASDFKLANAGKIACQFFEIGINSGMVPKSKSKPTRGGAREGAGRPRSSKYHWTLFITDREKKLLKVYLETLRLGDK